MHASIILLCRFMDVDFSVVEKIVSDLEGRRVSVAPILHPIKYPLEAYDWDSKKYDPAILLDFLNGMFSRYLSGHDIIVVALTSSIVGLEKSYLCSDNGRICLVAVESIQDAISSIYNLIKT